ncbi:putative ankyrin repeat-containing domain superfamily [Septoria linicola]|nr:putative ankyrin repeat-containing domain superfamily [Septoria linicola]
MDGDQASKFAIHAACREGQTRQVAALLNADPKLATKRDDDDRLPLHWAASYNRVDIVELLSDLKGFDVDSQDGSGWSALMMAASLKDGDEMVDCLLNKGADADVKNNNGQTALFFAASKSNLDTARKLIAQKASARVKDKRDQLPLHRAAAVGNVPIVKLLLANRSPVDATDIDGSTALHHAIAEGHGQTAVELLKAGADSSKKDRDGQLAIKLAPDKTVKEFILRMAEEEGIELATA